mmetsp:Transcript_26405/g.60181  ORF Transcript_26405/g.60181 Transcript_26405/m.60181 type:complete len:88 (-) Transcript_26405:639-902(-)
MLLRQQKDLQLYPQHWQERYLQMRKAFMKLVERSSRKWVPKLAVVPENEVQSVWRSDTEAKLSSRWRQYSTCKARCVSKYAAVADGW